MSDCPADDFSKGVDFVLRWAHDYSPRLLAVAVLLLVGILVSRLLAALVRRRLSHCGVDRVAARTDWVWLGKYLTADPRPSKIAGVVVQWIVLFGVFVAAAEVLGLTQISASLAGWLFYLPRFVGGVVLAFIGLWVATMSRRRLTDKLQSIGFELAIPSGRMLYSLLLLLTAALILAQLGLETALLRQVIVAMLVALGAIGALAFGLGSREIAANLIAGGYLRESYSEGDELGFEDVRGHLQQVGAVSCLLNTTDGQVSIPNRVLLNSTTKRFN